MLVSSKELSMLVSSKGVIDYSLIEVRFFKDEIFEKEK